MAETPHPWTAFADARTDLGLTRPELADKTGVSEAMIRALEAGTRQGTPRLLSKIADYLGVPVTTLQESQRTGAAIQPRVQRKQEE